MTRLLLVRHGDNNHLKKKIMYARMSSVHLNEYGHKQAAELAAALHEMRPAAIYASPLERAMETAEPIAAATGLEIQVDARLLDTNIGSWQGRSWKTVARTTAWKIIQNSPSRFRFPEGESFLEAQSRIVAALDEIVSRYGGNELVAVVFHADPIKLAVTHYLGLPLDHFQRLACDTGTTTLLDVEESGARLVWLNMRPPFRLSEIQSG